MRRSDELKASPPMFDSPLLDRFTRVHPAVPVVMYLPVILVLFALGADRSGFWNAVGHVLGGLIGADGRECSPALSADHRSAGAVRGCREAPSRTR